MILHSNSLLGIAFFLIPSVKYLVCKNQVALASKMIFPKTEKKNYFILLVSIIVIIKIEY